LAPAQNFREFIPTHPTPRGLISDPENDCVYIIFHREIKLYCENAPTQGSERKNYFCSQS
jgi:hypothetical protein